MSTTNSSAKRQLRFASIAFAVIALFLGLWTHHQNRQFAPRVELENGTLLPTPQAIVPFQLVGMDNKPFTNDSLKGHWSVIFFGFTQCPELCPTTLSLLNQVYKSMAHENKVKLPNIVFISVDPERDEPSDIKSYLSSFNPNFIGATGNKETLDKLTANFNVLYMKVAKANPVDKNDYLIDHSGTLLLLNPEAQLVAIFATPHDVKKLTHDLQTIEENHHA